MALDSAPARSDVAPAHVARRPILQVGRNCWRVAAARRAAMLVDGAAYFAAFAAAAERAQRSIRILGWDLNTDVRLRRGGTDRADAAQPGLADFLDGLTHRRPELRIDILSWDFAAIYAFEREIFTTLRFRYRTGPRVRLELDAQHPVGASQHQKVVVIDDAMAFVGGLDLTIDRWDTREHRPEDPRRRDDGRPYPPFHDVQLAVDGDAAGALGELFRRRWWRATGESLDPVPPCRDCWPDGLRPDLENVGVAIARTEPASDGEAEAREVERLYLDAIAAARDSIFVENQYLTSASVGEALCTRLAEASGPEVVVVGPRTCSGWLEEATMGVLRSRLVGRLRAADRHGRLRLLCPVVGGERRIAVNVHSKVMIVDDALLRVGSANLSNRSMGLDSECDLAIEAEDEASRRAIRALRSSLLAEHLGVESARLDARIAAGGSLVRAVDDLCTTAGERTLLPLDDGAVAPWLDGVVPDASLIDPDRPFEVTVLETLSAETQRRHRAPAWSRLVRTLGGVRRRLARWAAPAAEAAPPGTA